MQGVMATPAAILLELDTIGIILLVLFGRVIAALALGAGQGDQCTHEYSLYRNLRALKLHMNSKKEPGIGGCTNNPRL